MTMLDNPKREGPRVRETEVSHPWEGETSKVWRRDGQLFWQGDVKVVHEPCSSMACVFTCSHWELVLRYLRKLNSMWHSRGGLRGIVGLSLLVAEKTSLRVRCGSYYCARTHWRECMTFMHSCMTFMLAQVHLLLPPLKAMVLKWVQWGGGLGT